jgi:hypothetical protein
MRWSGQLGQRRNVHCLPGSRAAVRRRQLGHLAGHCAGEGRPRGRRRACQLSSRFRVRTSQKFLQEFFLFRKYRDKTLTKVGKTDRIRGPAGGEIPLICPNFPTIS